MKDNRTYIKLFRTVLDWGWYGDTNTFRVFMHILLRANYEPSEYRGHIIGAGECVFGYNAWAKALGLSVRNVRTAIEHLKSTNEITIKTTNKFSIIHVVKWEFWQIEEGKATSKSTSKPTNDRQATDKQPTTSKESKKVRNTTTTPTIQEVRAYVAEKNLMIDADYFYEYYTTAEWKDIKGNPIKNWKLKALNWNNREQKNGYDKTTNFGRSDKSGAETSRRNGDSKAELYRFKEA